MPRTRRHQSDEPQRRRHRPAAVAIAAAVALSAALSACSDDPDLDPGPPAPVQFTSTTPSSASVPSDPVVSIAPSAQRSADDPIVQAFRDYALVVTRLLRAGGDDRSGVSDVMTGTRLDRFIAELDQYINEGLSLYGTPEFQIVDISVIDNQHTHVLTCDLDSSSYPVKPDGAAARPVEEGWVAYEYWMTLVDERWKLEFLYTGDHTCQGTR